MLSLSCFSRRTLLPLLTTAALAACSAEAPPPPQAPVLSAAELEAANRAVFEALDPREQAASARFEMRNDGTAIDTTTGLITRDDQVKGDATCVNIAMHPWANCSDFGNGTHW